MQPSRLFRDCRVVLVPTQIPEAWCRVVSEAQVSGLPSVASSLGGLPESVGPGGILVAPPSSKQAWSEALAAIWDDHDRYEELSKRALDHSHRSEIAVDSVVRHFEGLVAQAIDDMRDAVRVRPNGSEGSRLMSIRTSLVERLPDNLVEPMRSLRFGRLRRQVRRRGYVVNRAGVKLFVDRDDSRALWLARNRGVTSSQVVRLWGRLVEELAPATVLDVGANYGEVTFSTTYPVGTSVHLVEANPVLVRLLQRTIDDSALADAASLHACAASDQTGFLTLHVSEESSGFS